MNSDGVLNIGETLGDLKPSSDTTQEDAYRIRAQRVEEKFEHAAPITMDTSASLSLALRWGALC